MPCLASASMWWLFAGVPGAIVTLPVALLAQWWILRRLSRRSLGECAALLALMYLSATVAGVAWLSLVAPIVDHRELASGAFVAYGYGSARGFVWGTLLLACAEAPLIVGVHWCWMRVAWRQEVASRRAIAIASLQAASTLALHAVTVIVLAITLATRPA